MKLNEFHKINIARQHEAFAPAHSLTALVVCVQEEIGELAGAVLGVTGEKKRKAHLTRADVLDAVADAMTYLSLVAGSVGCDDLEGLLAETFNMVSDRVGSKFKIKSNSEMVCDVLAHLTVLSAAKKLASLVRSRCDWESVADQHPDHKESERAIEMISALKAVEAL